jgi:thiamine biosynthesis lipoprotein
MQVRQMTQPDSRKSEAMEASSPPPCSTIAREDRERAALTRRRAIRIVAAAAGLPLLIAAVRAAAPAGQLYRWQGEVLGAASELVLWHTDAALAQRTILRVRGEIARYERIFSLYRPDSEISRLNADGALAKPSPELRALVDASQRLSVLSGGAFDISVQPLWRLYEAHFWSHSDIQPDILARARDVARDLVDFRNIDAGHTRIALARAGMGITLNSLAQGFITDAVADLLRNEGFDSAVVDLGEFRTLGRHPDGHPWRIGIRDGMARGGIDGETEGSGRPDGGIARTVELEDTALAVSGGYGTTFEPTGRFHHIFDPHTGASANSLVDVAVIGPRATAANGLSTAICVAGEARAAALLAAFPGTRAIVTRPDGTVGAIEAARIDNKEAGS